jgi:hypothetical protein
VDFVTFAFVVTLAVVFFALAAVDFVFDATFAVDFFTADFVFAADFFADFVALAAGFVAVDFFVVAMLLFSFVFKPRFN